MVKFFLLTPHYRNTELNFDERIINSELPGKCTKTPRLRNKNEFINSCLNINRKIYFHKYKQD